VHNHCYQNQVSKRETYKLASLTLFANKTIGVTIEKQSNSSDPMQSEKNNLDKECLADLSYELKTTDSTSFASTYPGEPQKYLYDLFH
jgi:hypothetical protein